MQSTFTPKPLRLAASLPRTQVSYSPSLQVSCDTTATTIFNSEHDHGVRSITDQEREHRLINTPVSVRVCLQGHRATQRRCGPHNRTLRLHVVPMCCNVCCGVIVYTRIGSLTSSLPPRTSSPVLSPMRHPSCEKLPNDFECLENLI